MKILLTAEQQDHLIEMIKALFPEYKTVRWGKKWDAEEIWLSNYEINEIYTSTKPIINSEIHWFEFCMTHLIRRLEKALPFNGREQPYHTKLMFFTFYGSNPIDRLYEQFKKSKY